MLRGRETEHSVLNVHEHRIAEIVAFAALEIAKGEWLSWYQEIGLYPPILPRKLLP